VIHLRVIAPREQADKACELFCNLATATHVVRLPGAAIEPEGDLLLVDVPDEDASVLIGDLKELGIHELGSITVENVDTQLSTRAEQAEKDAPGAPADAVVWEEVEARTSEQATLAWSYLIFMVLAGLIAACGIFLDSAILIVGAMVVGPEFGPIAAFCVAVVERRGRLALRSITALAVGLPLATVAVLLATLAFRATGVTPDTFSDADHSLSSSISNPDFFAFFVAFCAGIAGMLSLSTAKSGALIGVLISVTTIPAASNVGVALAYGDRDGWTGSLAQLAINVAGILTAGILTLWIQRLLYRVRRRRHLNEERPREAAGLPVGVSARSPEPTRPRASSGSG
jgi:uncharacterized hydrophobic protein (TIGR00271 family)